ncbi:galectin [Carabus blaptoides fortunei]
MDDSDSVDNVKCCGFVCCRRKRDPATANTTVEHSAEDIAKSVYCGDLPQPLLPGHCIELTGAPLEYCTRFSINFTCGKSSQSDIAFHFNPRLEQKYTVRNARLNGYWGAEETVSCHRCDLPRETQFTLAFFISPREFMVAVNGIHFCTFIYRVPLDKVKFVEAHGDVTIDTVEVKEMSQYPPETLKNELNLVPFQESLHNEKLPNPFIGRLPKGLQPGWQLEIFGKVKLLPHSFYINLQEGNQYWPHPIIPLHLNSRFNTQVNAHSLIRNAWINGAWGAEERSPGFHFVPGRNFHVIIRMEAESFSVWVDGKMEGEFRFRIMSSAIDTVYIEGDIFLYKIFINDKVANMLIDNLMQ